MAASIEATGPNEDQIAYWNDEAGAKWVGRQERLDRMLRPHTERLLAAAAPAPGESVIDIGCGCGDTTLEVAGRVGPRGRVLGVDVSAAMLARARERAAAAGYDNVAFANEDASSHDFGGGHDLALSRFGVMFFRNAEAAFGHIRNALKPGGRLAFICWRAPEHNPWMTSLGEITAGILPEAPPVDFDEPGPCAFAPEAKIRRILEAGSFATVGIEPVDLEVRIDGTVEEVVDFQTKFGPFARRLAEQPEDIQARAVAVIREELARRHDGAGITEGAGIWLVTAHA